MADEESSGGPNRLVGADQAIIDPRKFTEYALDPDHPDGRHKARVFEAALGYNQNNYQALIEQIRRGILEHGPVVGKVDQYGTRYTVDIPVRGPSGDAVVRTGWVYDLDSSVPRLVTVFVREET